MAKVRTLCYYSPAGGSTTVYKSICHNDCRDRLLNSRCRLVSACALIFISPRWPKHVPRQWRCSLHWRHSLLWQTSAAMDVWREASVMFWLVLVFAFAIEGEFIWQRNSCFCAVRNTMLGFPVERRQIFTIRFIRKSDLENVCVECF